MWCSFYIIYERWLLCDLSLVQCVCDLSVHQMFVSCSVSVCFVSIAVEECPISPLISLEQLVPDRPVIDRDTLAWRVLLCPQWACSHLHHFHLNQGIILQWQIEKGGGGGGTESESRGWVGEGSNEWPLVWANYSISWSEKVLCLSQTLFF